jgi:hypothetical protein
MAEKQKKTVPVQSKTPEQLQNEVHSLAELLREALIEIERLKKQLNIYEKQYADYNPSWSMVTKMVYIIAKADKPLRSSELIPLLKVLEPSIVDKQESLEKYISAFLNTAMKHERLIPHKLKGVRGNFYCLPEWIDERQQLLPEMRKKIF